MTKETNNTMIEKAASNMIGLATKANDYVLATTEQAFDASFNIANKSLDLTGKVIKRGLDITATQQEMVFGVLGGLKNRIFKN